MDFFVLLRFVKESNMKPHNMKKIVLSLTLMLALLQIGWAQQRDRLAELDLVCTNWIVTHASVAPDGSIWMATRCGEIYRADDIYSTWQILQEGELLSDEDFENIAAFDRNTAVMVGNMWSYIKRTSTGGQSWDSVKNMLANVDTSGSIPYGAVREDASGLALKTAIWLSVPTAGVLSPHCSTSLSTIRWVSRTST